MSLIWFLGLCEFKMTFNLTVLNNETVLILSIIITLEVKCYFNKLSETMQVMKIFHFHKIFIATFQGLDAPILKNELQYFTSFKRSKRNLFNPVNLFFVKVLK